MRPKNNLLHLQPTPPERSTIPRPLYLNRIINRLRTKPWYFVPTGPEYLYYMVQWNPAMKWHYRDIQADIHLTGSMASTIMNDPVKGYCIVFCQELMVPDTYRVKLIGPDYDPRKIY